MTTKPLVAEANPLLGGGVLAVLAAVAFGITVPLIQRFGRGVGPIPSATLLYAGAVLASFDLSGKIGRREASVRSEHVPRLLAIALLGAVLAPIGLTWGLQHTSASSASLSLNFEAIFTVFFAWLLYREPIGRRVGVALALMAAGGGCLVLVGSWVAGVGLGLGAVVVATLAWALDNTLTRPLADLNPLQVVRWKAALGAAFGAVLWLFLGQPLPRPLAMLALLLCGGTGYGLSLRLYLLAQRRIGAGRTGSIFALGPFVGAAAAWVLGDRSGSILTVAAAALFGLGVYLHLTEVHAHPHTHEPVEHEHAHRHDDGHHTHAHAPLVVGEHNHLHQHEATPHEHPHGPDLHHHHDHP